MCSCRSPARTYRPETALGTPPRSQRVGDVRVSAEYLAREDGYELDPRLAKHTGQQQTAEGQALFGAFSDAAPDGWGRRLIRRNEIHHAEKHGVPERDIPENDYLLSVRDQLRQARSGQLDVLLLGLLQKLLSQLLLINDICSHRPDHLVLIGRID
ncbi:MAG TPA: hypothetical protein VGG98_08075 [Solirubrobacteraceae bacterium]|jgi:hypothetical protein